MSTNETLFDDEFLKKLEYLNIISKRIFAGQFKAERRARKRGSGLEFADFRGYVPGDDFRYLDWKSYLRLNKLLLKLYEEEEDLPIYVFVDASRSMAYGTPSKLDYAKRVAAALCYIGLANLDRITIVAFGDGLKSHLPATRGKSQIFKVFRFLSEVQPTGETDARAAFRSFFTETRRRGLAVVITDLFDPHGFRDAIDVVRHFKHDIFVIQVVSQDDVEPAVRGELILVDAENQAAREATITPRLVAAYKTEFAKFCTEIESYCWKYQLGYLRAVTSFPFDELILRVFRQGRFVK